MTRINLLPVKAARRLEAAQRELSYALGALVLLVAALGTWYSAEASHLSDLDSRLAAAQNSISALNEQAAQIDNIKQQAAQLEQKLQGVDVLKQARSGPARMMADVADIFTRQPQVWLTRFSESDGHVSIEGGAVDQEQVSALQLSISHDSKFFTDVTLGIVNAVHEAGVDYVTWSMTCTLHYDAS